MHQQEIETIRESLRHLQESWPIEVSLIPNPPPSIYDYYPYLFLQAFPSLTSAEVKPLALAGRLFTTSLVLSDEIMDGDSNPKLMMPSILSIQALQMEAYHLLHQIFPPKATFWERFHSFMVKYTDACVQEQKFISRTRPWQEYTEELALKITLGRNCMAGVFIAGLVELAEDDSLLNTLVEAIDYFNIAYQMLDDLLDWKDDLRSGIPSLLLSRIVDEWPTNCNPEKLSSQSSQLIHKIYYGGHLEYIVQLALESLDHSDSLTVNISNLEWRSITENLRQRFQILLQDTDQIMHANLQRSHNQPKFNLVLPPVQNLWQQIISDGLGFIVKQWQLGFGEARHIMSFPHEQGFKGEKEYQYGDVFQRAIITDILCDLNNLYSGQLLPIINYEADYLVSCRKTSGIGGWSYFPNLPELPPDADDLAQIIQILLRSGRREQVIEYCETPLTVLLNNCVHSDGSFESWIVPNINRTPEQEYQAYWVKTAWGMGPDIDVIANLLYALTLYDKVRFADPILKGTNYLKAHQQANGSWISTWYHGAYYGTYVCLKLLGSISPDSPTNQQALHFLQSTQRIDGGWGVEDESDPLNTALALLGLAFAQGDSVNSSDVSRAEKALAYLQRSQEINKDWRSCKFIQMQLGRVSGKVNQILSYGSRTITTAFVLKAATTWQQLMTTSVSLSNSDNIGETEQQTATSLL